VTDLAVPARDGGSGSSGLSPKAASSVKLEAADQSLAVSGPEFEVVFDRVTGEMTELRSQGHDLIASPLRPNLWRAPTDNDVGQPENRTFLTGLNDIVESNGGEFPMENPWHVSFAELWREYALDALQFRVDSIEGSKLEDRVQVDIAGRLAPPMYDHGFDVSQTYTVDGTGTIRIDTSLSPEGDFSDLPSLPRVGYVVDVPGDMDSVTWYGNGPGESYADSDEAVRIGEYERDVETLHTPYVRPQENGNRTGIRWVALTDDAGVGLCASGSGLNEFSAHHYSIDALEAATHTHDLERREPVTLTLDHANCGVGSGSCGLWTLPEYRIPVTDYEFTLELQLVTMTDSVGPDV